MWPMLLDMTKEESMQSLRNLELEAYAHLVSALRAQGPLSSDKRKLLRDTSQVLNIPQDRHKAEVRRAVNDERLNTIAFHVTGFSESLEDWAQEGRRSIPLIPRMAPQTAYSAIADEAAESANQSNKQMPHPATTERKRTASQPVTQLLAETSKGASFRVPEVPKSEEIKKRKYPICTENSSLAQHLLGPAKLSRSHQLYRQRMKSGVLKEHGKVKSPTLKVPFTPLVQSPNSSKINLLQNVVVNSPQQEETIEQIQNEINNYTKPEAITPSSSNENQIPRNKLLTPTKSAPNVTFKQFNSTPVTTSELPRGMKICTPKKSLTTKAGVPIGQKLIVVSNAQTMQNNSILQKTLSIPLVKNISVKNLEKFKIVTSSASPITPGGNITTFKHKVVTVKTNPTTKKVIPLSLLNSKGGIKVLPIGGKIVGKGTTTTSSPPLYIVNTMNSKALSPTALISDALQAPEKENGKSTVLCDILQASGVTSEDFDTKIEEFRIPNNHVIAAENLEPTEIKEEKEELFYEDDDGTEVKVKSEEDIKQLDSEEEMVLQIQNPEISVNDTDN